MAPLRFTDWWQRDENRQQDFWRISERGVAVSLGETPRKIFRQILQLLKGYHDDNVGYGRLQQGVRIDENMQVDLIDYGRNPNIPRAQRLASIRQDMLDFKKLLTWVERQISTAQLVNPAYSSRKFHGLYGLLDHYSNSFDGLRRFGFFMRNNPLFLDDTAKFLFFRKVLTLKEFNVGDFHINVELKSLNRWSDGVRNEDLLAVKNYKGGNPTSQGGNPTSQGDLLDVKNYKGGNPTSQSGNPTSQSGNPTNGNPSQSGNPTSGNPTSQSGNPTSQSGNPTSQSKYNFPDESIVFFRNCLGHLREKNADARYHDAQILRALEDDLPNVIPVWFYELVRQLDLNKQKCWEMCGCGWMEFLSMQLTVFT